MGKQYGTELLAENKFIRGLVKILFENMYGPLAQKKQFMSTIGVRAI